MAMKRKAPRAPRRYRKRARIPRRIPRPRRAPGTLLANRTQYAGTWTFGTAAVSDFWRFITYDMNAMTNFGEFATVFDEYKLNRIKITFRPQYDSVSNPTAAGALAQPQAYAHYLVDPGSIVIPAGVYGSTSLNTFLENQGVKTRTLNRPFSIYWKPQVTDQVSGTGTSSVMRRTPWVRTSDLGTSYRGVHMYLQQNSLSTGNTNIKLDMFVTFYLTFRNVR